MSLALDEIINIYENCRHWYVTPSSMPESSQRVGSLKDCLTNVDLVLLDSYGVLCRGPEVIKEALHAIAYLRQHNIPFCVVSNDTMNGWRTVEGKYSKLGFDLKSSEIVTSLDVTEAFLKQFTTHNNFAATGYAQNPIGPDFPQIQDLNSKQGMLTSEAESLMFLVGKGWQSDWQENLINSSNGIQKVILANPDVGAPSENVFLPTPGYYAYDFYKRTNFNTKPILLGKPDPVMFKHALDFMNYKGRSENVLMVGDSLHTDILGGLGMGFKTLLVESGIFTGGKAEEYIQKTGIVPHYISAHI